MSDRPRRQEQERASAEVAEVAPGVLRAQLPINMPGLGHVNCYALEDSRGVAIVDPGLPGPLSWEALERRLQDAQLPLPRIHTVIVTHSHPDHFGGAARVRRETGADIVTHRAFRTLWDPFEPEGDDPEEGTMPALPAPQPPPGGGEPFRPMEQVPEEERVEAARRMLAETPRP